MDAADSCQEQCRHEESINKVKEKALNTAEVLALSEIFKAMGDPTRIRILYALLQSELCVCDLVEVLEMSQSAVSHQLRILRNLRLVKFAGMVKMFYSLDDEHIINFFLLKD